ncbi:acyl-CoA dehydrogenase family protein [Streptomyces sp. LP05-1]|uniref:Acyl-CoA dehydrogenase family protein n=1 Tax=Streptomyces pyxinae TaxID=2970734 RepID=A0ABT2CK01_9ACTN|nr:acyl-CoA dehydrogenase family protein [Streptomyces sp. LP05-1]MCS0637737.1 acyl-CoA dehydrogenase family protein [Streptomyces sp. LP05-1]
MTTQQQRPDAEHQHSDAGHRPHSSGGVRVHQADPGAVEADFYHVRDLVAPEDRERLEAVRDWARKNVAPVAADYWERGEFPYELIAQLPELGIAGLQFSGYGAPGRGALVAGLTSMELSRVDPSFATFYGVHSGLGIATVMQCGSEEQKERWIPAMLRWEKLAAFALTEPDVGSGASRGLTTTARREGDTWILDGRKKWIGNATFADLVIVWAKDEADDQVKGFVVERGTPGFEPHRIEGKVSLRSVQNAEIELRGVRVPEENRLAEAHSFKDTAKVLRSTRLGVSWNAVGCAMGAYEAARAYTLEREQFGKPIAAFQLVQDQLARMLADITACQTMNVRAAQLQDAGQLTDQQASLAKMYSTSRTREVVAHAREILGGNGILLDHEVARFWADAEALYSYEGTRDMNALIVGRAATGISAFV